MRALTPVAAGLLISAFLSGGAWGDPMTFQVVRAATLPSCEPDCPEWIAAQGTIPRGAAAVFRQFLAGLDDRCRPVLINSGGGSITDAIEIGRMIRARKLAVAVARTTLGPPPTRESELARKRFEQMARGFTGTSVILTPPPDVAKIAPPGLGRASGFPAFCASACTLVLAAGVERFASPLATIGLHQAKQTITHTYVTRRALVHHRIVNGVKQEVSREIYSGDVRTDTSVEVSPPSLNAEMAAYYKQMGEDPRLVEIMQTATPDQIHYMTAEEETATRMVTAWIDERTAFIARFPDNGLSATPVTPDRRPDVEASGVWPLEPHADGSARKLSLRLTFRRGGAGVTATWALDARPGASLRFGVTGQAPATSRDNAGERTIPAFWPTAAFCRAARFSDIVASVAPTHPPTHAAGLPDARAPLLAAPLASLDGMAALVDEVCPKAPARTLPSPRKR